MDVVLCLGFDLFFRPKLEQAAASAGVRLRHARPEEAETAAQGAVRVVADVSAPGVEAALARLRERHVSLPIFACFPHVEVQRAQAVRALGGVAVARGAFVERLGEALRGELR